jgi:hypothetical protein
VPPVYFGGQLLSVTHPPLNNPGFFLVQAEGVATNSTTILEFIAPGYIDDVRVISAHAPLQIIAQPQASRHLLAAAPPL